VEIATRVPHQDIHNPHEEELTVRRTVEPVNDFVEAFADSYIYLLTRDKLDGQDEFRPLQLFPVLHATRAQSRITSIPIPLQKLLIPVGARIGAYAGTGLTTTG
jgi:hypothetical protein